MALLHQFEARFKVSTQAVELLVHALAIVLMDRAPCHSKKFLEQREGEEHSSHP